MLSVESGNNEAQLAPHSEGPLPNDDEMWAAAMARDDKWDGKFVFAVHSTGVYCRPSCGAKRPSRDRVSFYSTPDRAEVAGFRACRRCRPRGSSAPAVELVKRVTGVIDSSNTKNLTLERLSAEAGVSKFHLQRTFKKVLGISPREYVEARRLDAMKHSLRRGETVTNALYEAGFSSRSRIYEKVPKPLGVDPGMVRRGGEGLQIQYTVMDSPIGRLLVASTQRGLCAVCQGDSDAAVESALREEYPEATLTRNDNDLKSWVSSLSRYFDGKRLPEDVPLDVRATAFQREVWKHIQSIPYGSTSTYSGIANAIGTPQAARAVARACATNPVSIIVPCHRVIGKDGDLRGYKWGIGRKETLLNLERNKKQPS